MTSRITKKSIPPRSRPRTTAAPEPVTSTRPTMRDLPRAEALAKATARPSGPRGEYSLPSARGVPTDVVSGEINPGARAARGSDRPMRPTEPLRHDIYVTAATQTELRVVVQGHELRLDRAAARALASLLTDAFR